MLVASRLSCRTRFVSWLFAGSNAGSCTGSRHTLAVVDMLGRQQRQCLGTTQLLIGQSPPAGCIAAGMFSP
jgi:hypothetical protein